MGVTVYHSRTATGANNTAYDVQLQRDWNASHLFTLNAAGSEISQAFNNGGGVTFGLETNGSITAAAPVGAPSPVNFSAGTTSNNLASVVFSNSNGVSFGLNGSTITATVVTTQSNQNVTAANGGFAFQTLSFSNANNFSFGTSAGSAITGSYTVPTVTNSSWTVSDTATSATVGRLAFTAANGITMTLSTSNNGNHTVFASYTVPTVTNSSWTVSDAATSGTVGRLAFTNLNGVTLSLSTGAGGSHTIVGSHNALTSQSNQAVSNSAGSFTFQTLNFSNANNVTWGTSAGGIVTASVAAGAGGVAAGVSNTGNTLGNTGTASAGTIVFAGSGGITASESTAAGQSTIWFSVANTVAQSNQTLGLYALGNTTQNSSSTFDARTVSFNALGAMTWGYSNGSVQVSAPATSSIVGTNGISVSTAGSTISVLPQWISFYENMEGMAGSATQTFNAASVSYAVAFNMPQPVSASFLRIPALLTTNSTTIATMASATASASGEIYSTWNAVIYSLGVGGNSKSLQSVVSGSAGFTFRNSISITNSTQYSITQGFSAQALGAGTTRTTQYSISNTNYSFTTDQIATEWSSNRMIDIPFANSLTPGAYWGIFGLSTSSASAGAAGLAALTNCNVRYSNHYGISQMDLTFGIMGSTNRTSGGLLGAGSFSTAGGGTTNSIPVSAISSNASNARMYFQLHRSA